MDKKKLVKGKDWHGWCLKTKNGKFRSAWTTRDDAMTCKYYYYRNDTVVRVKYVEVPDE